MIHRWKDVKRKRFTTKQIAEAEDRAKRDILKTKHNTRGKILHARIIDQLLFELWDLVACYWHITNLADVLPREQREWLHRELIDNLIPDGKRIKAQGTFLNRAQVKLNSWRSSPLPPHSRKRLLATRQKDKIVEKLCELIRKTRPENNMSILLAARRARVLKEFGWMTAEQLAEANGSETANRRALVDNWKKRHQVFSVPHRDAKKEQREVFILFQFDKNLRPIKAMREIIEVFGERKSPWKLALWFASNNGWLPNQARPVDLLTSSPDAVIKAACRETGKRIWENR
jgi:hypothetical protein